MGLSKKYTGTQNLHCHRPPHLEAVKNGATLVLVAHLQTVIRLGRLLPDAAVFLCHLRAVQVSLQLHVQVLRDRDGPLRGWQHHTEGVYLKIISRPCSGSQGSGWPA